MSKQVGGSRYINGVIYHYIIIIIIIFITILIYTKDVITRQVVRMASQVGRRRWMIGDRERTIKIR